jgi:hypothetical protein
LSIVNFTFKLTIGFAFSLTLFILTFGLLPFVFATTQQQGRVSFQPYCVQIGQLETVIVSGVVSPHSSSGNNIHSVSVWWRLNNATNWTQLPNLSLASTFPTDGGFSLPWNPPAIGFYEFEANWTTSQNQTITAVTQVPLRVVDAWPSCLSSATNASVTSSATVSGHQKQPVGAASPTYLPPGIITTSYIILGVFVALGLIFGFLISKGNPGILR